MDLASMLDGINVGMLRDFIWMEKDAIKERYNR